VKAVTRSQGEQLHEARSFLESPSVLIYFAIAYRNRKAAQQPDPHGPRFLGACLGQKCIRLGSHAFPPWETLHDSGETTTHEEASMPLITCQEAMTVHHLLPTALVPARMLLLAVRADGCTAKLVWKELLLLGRILPSL
jgi:hypothetical protein